MQATTNSQENDIAISVCSITEADFSSSVCVRSSIELSLDQSCSVPQNDEFSEPDSDHRLLAMASRVQQEAQQVAGPRGGQCENCLQERPSEVKKQTCNIIHTRVRRFASPGSSGGWDPWNETVVELFQQLGVNLDLELNV
jgi:hypothetical protein